jgi:hypothetical protein
LTDTDKPRFQLSLVFIETGCRVTLGEPTIIDEALLDEAWNMLNDFIMDKLDEAQVEVTDEQFREIFIEICYHLVHREMSILRLLPVWEQGWKERLGTRKRGIRSPSRKDPYGIHREDI